MVAMAQEKHILPHVSARNFDYFSTISAISVFNFSIPIASSIFSYLFNFLQQFQTNADNHDNPIFARIHYRPVLQDIKPL